MGVRDHKRGFAGLIGLASDLRLDDEPPGEAEPPDVEDSDGPPTEQHSTDRAGAAQLFTRWGRRVGFGTVFTICAMMFVIWLNFGRDGDLVSSKPFSGRSRATPLVNASVAPDAPKPVESGDQHGLMDTAPEFSNDGVPGTSTSHELLAQEGSTVQPSESAPTPTGTALSEPTASPNPASSPTATSENRADILWREIEALRTQARALKSQLNDLDTQIKTLKGEMADLQGDEYRAATRKRNTLIKSQNSIYEECTKIVNQLNKKVGEYNSLTAQPGKPRH